MAFRSFGSCPCRSTATTQTFSPCFSLKAYTRAASYCSTSFGTKSTTRTLASAVQLLAHWTFLRRSCAGRPRPPPPYQPPPTTHTSRLCRSPIGDSTLCLRTHPNSKVHQIPPNFIQHSSQIYSYNTILHFKCKRTLLYANSSRSGRAQTTQIQVDREARKQLIFRYLGKRANYTISSRSVLPRGPRGLLVVRRVSPEQRQHERGVNLGQHGVRCTFLAVRSGHLVFTRSQYYRVGTSLVYSYTIFVYSYSRILVFNDRRNNIFSEPNFSFIFI